MRMASERLDATLKPTGDGRLDLAEIGSIEGLAFHLTIDGMPLEFTADRANATIATGGIPIDRIVGLWGALLDLRRWAVQALAAPGSDEKMEPPLLDAATLEHLQGLARGLAESVRIEERYENLQVVTAEIRAGLGHFGIGFGGHQDNGQIATYLDLELEDLSLPEAVAARAGGIGLRKFTFRPRIAGIDATALTDLALAGMDEHGNSGDWQQQAQRVFGPDGIRLSIQDLELDVGAARAVGAGSVIMTQSGDFGGQATIRSFGLEPLIAKLQKNPDLAQTVPALRFARSLGRPAGDNELLWEISIQNNDVLVNGIDLAKPKTRTKRR
jgi:hypothetical protein